MGPSVTDTFATALIKFSMSQKTIDKSLNEMSIKNLKTEHLLNESIERLSEKSNTTTQGSLLSNTVTKTKLFTEAITKPPLKTTSGVNICDSEDLD